MEVFNLFSGLVRQEGLSRMERAHQRQSLVPDLRIAILPQADLLPQEYLNKARAADQNHNQIQVGTIGPVERKLVELGEVRGIVAGNFGEVSEDTHALVAALATCRSGWLECREEERDT